MLWLLARKLHHSFQIRMCSTRKGEMKIWLHLPEGNCRANSFAVQSFRAFNKINLFSRAILCLIRVYIIVMKLVSIRYLWNPPNYSVFIKFSFVWVINICFHSAPHVSIALYDVCIVYCIVFYVGLTTLNKR